jgi:hypothetical protein
MNKTLFYFLIIIINCSCFKNFAQGDLIIIPKRVLFEKKQQKVMITLMNSGQESATYTVSFTQRSMSEDGKIKTITVPDEGQLFADPYLRIYPRRVTLIPGEAQSVILQRRRNSNLAEGEYRSHLYFRSEIDNTSLKKIIETDTLSTTMSISLTPIFGITIPVIFHSGKVNVTSNISDLKLNNLIVDKPFVTFTMHRIGNISLYGDIILEYQPENGKSFIIARTNGIAIYTTTKKRQMRINIKMQPKINLNKGSLKIKYFSRPGNKNQQIYAESKLLLTE